MFGHSKQTTFWSQVILTILAIIFISPLIIAIKISLQGEGIGNYLAVLKNPMLPHLFTNSVIVSFFTIILVYLVTILSAYAFSKLPIKHKEWYFNAILIGLMIPAISLVVPLFSIIKSLGWFNNYLALIGPYAAFGIPFTLLLMRNFLDEVPDTLIEAAKIDGGNSFQVLMHIIMPLAKPISIVVVIWTFLSSWNEYFMALVFMRNEAMYMITQAPQFYMGTYTSDTGKIFASLVLISLPVVIAYLFLQKYFENGMTSGSIK